MVAGVKCANEKFDRTDLRKRNLKLQHDLVTESIIRASIYTLRIPKNRNISDQINNFAKR